MSIRKGNIVVETVDEKSTTHSIKSFKSHYRNKTPYSRRAKSKKHISDRLSTKLLCKMSGQPSFVKQSAISETKTAPVSHTNTKPSVPIQVTPASEDIKQPFKLESSHSRHSNHTEREGTEHSKSNHNEDNSIRSNLSDKVDHIPPCKDYNNYYAYLYKYFGNSSFLTSQVKYLLEEVITLREKRDVLHFLKYNNPLYWKLYFSEHLGDDLFFTYKYGIIRLLTFWTLIENPNGPNRNVNYLRFTQKWKTVMEHFNRKFENHKVTDNLHHNPRYHSVSKLAERFKLRSDINRHFKDCKMGISNNGNPRTVFSDVPGMNKSISNHSSKHYHSVPPSLPDNYGKTPYKYKTPSIQRIPQYIHQNQDADGTTARAQLTDGELSTSRNPAYGITKLPSQRSTRSHNSHNSYYSLPVNKYSGSQHSTSSRPKFLNKEDGSQHSKANKGRPNDHNSHHSNRSRESKQSGRSTKGNQPTTGYGPYYGQIDPEPDDPIINVDSDPLKSKKPIRARAKFEKAKWDGLTQTFRPFMKSVEGHLLQVGAGYLIDQLFVHEYVANKAFICSYEFNDYFGVSPEQAKYDITYLYGILLTATSTKENRILTQHSDTHDGVLAWIAFKEDYAYGGSVSLRLRILSQEVKSPFNLRTHGSINNFLDDLEAKISELRTIRPSEYSELRCKEIVLESVESVEAIRDLYQTCKDNKDWDYKQSCRYLREESLDRDYISTPTKGIFHVNHEVTTAPVSTDISPSDSTNSLSLKESARCFINHVSQHGLGMAWNMFNVKSYRESLSIPDSIWIQLEPPIKMKIGEIRKKIREDRATKQDSKQPAKASKPLKTDTAEQKETPGTPPVTRSQSGGIPYQYPTMQGDNVTGKAKTSLTYFCKFLDSLPSDDDTDEDALAFHLNNVKTMNLFMLRIRAHLEYSVLVDEPHLISDSGADSWVFGQGTKRVGDTGDFALLSGFDPYNQLPVKRPIVSAYIKALTLPHFIPVILLVHNGAWNPDSPVTLCSEYQSRDFGIVIDSIPIKHRASLDGRMGTQQMYLNEKVSIPFEDRGGLMGFKILPYEEGDEFKYDVFTLTSKAKWNPHKHKKLCHVAQEYPVASLEEDSSIEDSLPDLKVEVVPTQLAPEMDNSSISTAELPDLIVRGKQPPSEDSDDSEDEVEDIPPIPSEITTNSTRRRSTKHSRHYRMKRDVSKKGRSLKRSRRRRILHTITDNIDMKYYDPADKEEVTKDISVNKVSTETLDGHDNNGNSGNAIDDFLNTLSYEQLVGQSEQGYPHGVHNGQNNTDVKRWMKDFDEVFNDKEESIKSTYIYATRAWRRIIHPDVNVNSLRKFFLGRPRRVIKKTLDRTTQLATMILRNPLRRHVKYRAPARSVMRLDEEVSADPFFANVASIFHGYTGLYVFFCRKSRLIDAEGLKQKSQFPDLYLDFMRKWGVPKSLRRDNALEQCSEQVTEINRERGVKDTYSEPYNPQQNPVELNAVKFVKEGTIRLLTMTGAPIVLWYFAAMLVISIHNICSNPLLPDEMSPLQYLRGETPDISAYLQYTFYQRVLYLDHEGSFPESKERSGRWLGVCDNTGDSLTFHILDEQSKQILSRSVVRPYYDNLHVTWDTRLAVYNNEKRTANNAGEVMPSKEKRDKLLNELMDEYDQDEEEPNGIERIAKAEISNSILKKEEVGTELADDLMVSRDEIKENGMHLYFDWKPLPLRKDNEVLKWEGKKSYHDLRNDYTYKPSTSQQYVKPSNSKVTFEKELKTPHPSRYKDKLRSYKRKAKKALALLTMSMGSMTPELMMGFNGTQNIISSDTRDLSANLASIYTEPLENGHQLEELRAYHSRLDLLKQMLNPEVSDHDWRVENIVEYRETKTESPRAFFKVLWFGGKKQWVSMDNLRMHDPYLVIRYGSKHDLLNNILWGWTKAYGILDEAYNNLVRAYAVSLKKNKIKFGIEVPKSTREAYRLDNRNKNDLWGQSMITEVSQLLDYKTFKVIQDDEPVPPGYKWIPYHCVYDAKFDGRRKCRLVAGGHMTNPSSEDVFSGVVGMETVRLGFILAKMNNLLVCAGDIGNAFLYGRTKEKVYIKAGNEFPEHMRGKRLLIVKALYGLKSSSSRFHEHLSQKLLTLGYKPTKVDADLWYKKVGDHYEYIARYVDDVICFSREPMKVMEKLQETYIMKGVGKPQYYLGGDVVELGQEWEPENITTAFSAETYINNCLPKLAKVCGINEFAKHKVPMSETYHPELDTTPLLEPKDITLYKSLLGSANWIITLGRFDIAYATNTMARYGMAPREGHLKALKQIFGYLRNRPNGQILIDINDPPIRKEAFVSKDQNWTEFYPYAREEIPEDMLETLGGKATLTCYVDSDHARDQVTRRSVTGILLLLNNTPLVWISKRQGTVETSTYGAELIASRIAVELLIAWRYNLRMLGIDLEDESYLVGDNMSVVLNTTIPSSVLKKKNQSCNYHKVRESIAGGYIVFGHIPTEENVADVATKPLGSASLYYLTSKYLFRKAKVTEKAKEKSEKE